MRIRWTFIVGVLVTSFCLVSLDSSSSNSAAAPSGSMQTKEVDAAARKAWPGFFAEFREAVNKRDREALSKLMSADKYDAQCAAEG